MRRVWLVGLLLLCGWKAMQWWQLRPVTQPDGVLIADEPEQDTQASSTVFTRGDYTLTPRAHYHFRARLLHREPYSFGRESQLSPLDFAIGWGPLSDNRVLNRLELSQSNRFLHYRWRGQPPVPPAVLVDHAANTHLIPADKSVAAALAKMRPGQVVELDGWLVDASASDGWYWHTSLTREDDGAGACELMWVNSADVFLRGN